MMARVRDACDVKATTMEEKGKENTSVVYGDFHKPKSNPYLCTNSVGVPTLGWVMLDLLRSRSNVGYFEMMICKKIMI